MDSLIKWRPKKKYRIQSANKLALRREKYKIISIGPNIPPLITSFRSMRIPSPFRSALKTLKIKRPTSLQMQGLPAVLSGRDTLLTSISREGKTLIFSLPLIIASIQEELRLAFIASEGPLGLIIVPSRELASQISDFLNSFLSSLKTYPKISICLCTGGIDMNTQIEALQKGVHIVISTPGRLSDMIQKGKLNLKLCRILVLDEADRLLDLGFDDEVRTVLSNTVYNLQLILSSSTVPKRMQEFATNFMKSPIYVCSSRLLLKKLKLRQRNDLVPTEQKLVKLVEVMLRTDPPVLIFCEDKTGSDAIDEYLRKRGVDCASLHGGKAQVIRARAISEFNKRETNVLIATDMAAKGLSFNKVRHIINYDMPKDIDAYIQRICRANEKAVISNFLSYKLEKKLLKDLAEFLHDMADEVPEFLREIGGIEEKCEFCGTREHQKGSCGLMLLDLLKSEYPIAY